MTPAPLNSITIAVVAVLAGIGIGLGLAWLWRWYRLRRQRLALIARITSVSIDHVRDVLVPDGNGGVMHLDYVLLTPRGLLVIDLRDESIGPAQSLAGDRIELAGQPFLRIAASDTLMAMLLVGHVSWNIADAALFLDYERQPNVYDPSLYVLLNFLRI